MLKIEKKKLQSIFVIKCLKWKGGKGSTYNCTEFGQIINNVQKAESRIPFEGFFRYMGYIIVH